MADLSYLTEVCNTEYQRSIVGMFTAGKTGPEIAKELGMEADEVLRLQQITGLAGLFADREFSEAWEADSFAEVEGEDAKDQ